MIVGMVNLNDQDYHTSYQFHPAVIITDWVAFFILFFSAVIIGKKLMQFKGPSEQPEDFFFGYSAQDEAHSNLV
jgi:hypothetical protein